MKSSTRAYLYSIFGFLVPCWIANWGLSEKADLVGPNFYVFFSLTMFALSCWGVGLGLIYLGQWKYVLLAGLGRVVVIAGFAAFDLAALSDSEPAGHPYLTFIGVVLAFSWGTYDLARISFYFQNEKKKQSALAEKNESIE